MQTTYQPLYPPLYMPTYAYTDMGQSRIGTVPFWNRPIYNGYSKTQCSHVSMSNTYSVQTKVRKSYNSLYLSL